MFRRRRKFSLGERLRELVWPRAGWVRWGRYQMHRLRRLPGSPYSIAAGFACGAAVSFTPFLGLHFMLAVLIAWIIGANVFASAVGTAVGNPWTFPFIWLWIYQLGLLILGQDVANDLSAELFDEFNAYISSHPAAYVLSHPGQAFKLIWPVFLPMLVGGVPTGIVAWCCFYWPLRRAVESYQHHRRKRVRANRVGRRRPAARQETRG